MQDHHSDVIEDNIETHPVRLAIGVVLGAIALVVGILLLAEFAVVSWGSRSKASDPSMAPDAVAKRIAPVATVAVDANAPDASAPKAAPAPAAAPVVTPAAIPAPVAKTAEVSGGAGKAVYDASCSACHATGVAGAPRIGDQGAWAARLKAGKDALYTSAVKGKGAMPPKGGNASLSDADVKAAVDFLVAAR
jgi:cytochrome c5